MGMVGSMIVYGALVWYKELMASRGSLALLQGLQRRLAIQITRGYRITSGETALVVSGSISWDLLAEAYASLYEWRATLRKRDIIPTPRAVGIVRLQFRQLAMEKWKEKAHVSHEAPRSGTREERRSPPEALPNPTPYGERREHAPGGTPRRARNARPIPLPILGGREAHSGLGGLGPERETRTPTARRKPGGGRGVEVMPLCAATRERRCQ